MKYSDFTYSDELAEKLIKDTEMMSFMKSAVETNNPKQIMKAIHTVIQARDKREIVIRELACTVRDHPEIIVENLELFLKNN